MSKSGHSGNLPELISCSAFQAELRALISTKLRLVCYSNTWGTLASIRKVELHPFAIAVMVWWTRETTYSLELCQSTVCCYWFHNPDNLHWFAFKGVLPSYKRDSVWKGVAYQNHSYTDVSQQRRLSLQHLPPHRTEALPAPWMKACLSMWLPHAARMCPVKRPQLPLSYLLSLPYSVPWHKSPFSCLASSVVRLRNLMLWVVAYYYQPVPTPKIVRLEPHGGYCSFTFIVGLL